MSRVRQGSIVKLILQNQKRGPRGAKFVYIKGRAGSFEIKGDAVHTVIDDVTAEFAVLNKKRDGFDLPGISADNVGVWNGVFKMDIKNNMLFIHDAMGDYNAPELRIMQVWQLELQNPKGLLWNSKSITNRRLRPFFRKRKPIRKLRVGPRGGYYYLVRGRKVYQ
jgi:hypothetical protein